MKILWLPHMPLGVGRARGDHLIEKLLKTHDVRVLSFHIYPTTQLWRYLWDLFVHRTRRGPLYQEIALWRFPRLQWLNSFILNWVILRELSGGGYDALVVPPSPYLTGFIDFERVRKRVAIICDYLDGYDWNVCDVFERHYVQSSDAVLCVSHLLTEQALEVNPRSYYVPNGVELSRYRDYAANHSARECKIALGIDPDAVVASIIGITCSPRLYFIDAAMNLVRSGRKFVLLLVGDSPLLPEMRQRSGGDSQTVRIVGQIPYAKILPYFMASDIGLNLADDDPYFHRQSPLKIFEYAAMGKPVLVAPVLDEVVRMGLPNVAFCEAEAESVAQHLDRLAGGGLTAIHADLAEYDWDRITERVEEILQEAIRERVGRDRHWNSNS